MSDDCTAEMQQSPAQQTGLPGENWNRLRIFYHQITCTFPETVWSVWSSTAAARLMDITILQLTSRYRDWPINQTLDALEASFRRPAQPRHADTHKLIRFQLRWSPGPASVEERDASFKRSNCQQALTGNILIQAQGPSKYFIKFHEIHFLIH